jgi:predicted ester cyclase
MQLSTLDLIALTPTLFGDGPPPASPAFQLRACHPVNEGGGANFFLETLCAPLAAAFAAGQERTDIALSGQWKGGDWLARSGHLAGVFCGDLWGIPASGRVAFLRYGRFDRFESGELVETIVLLDLPHLMIEAGVWPVGPALSRLVVAPGPASHDGIVANADLAESAASLTLVEAMIGGLHKFDGDLKTMRMTSYWHDDFWWFGPAPIGSFRGHKDYERGHQRPFLTAFPDRVGGNHAARIAQGAYVASTGWPSIRATHSGGDWLGLPPTGRAITMRVMDFWRREGDQLVENWVMIDVPDLLLQMGVDVFTRMRALLP